LPTTKPTKKTPAPAPVSKKAAASTAKTIKKVKKNPIFEPRPRNFGVGNALRPKQDLTRFVKWPKYIRLQRQRKIIYQRLKVPPSINAFTQALDRNTAKKLFELLDKYRPETKTQKADRLKAQAADKVTGKDKKKTLKAPLFVKFGLNHVTALVENKKASLVVIAGDVDPIELVVWLPALCRKMKVPYCIVRSKAMLGKVVHQKTATALVVTGVRQEDKQEFSQLVNAADSQYNERHDDIRKIWGGGVMGVRSQHKTVAREKALAKERAGREAKKH